MIPHLFQYLFLRGKKLVFEKKLSKLHLAMVVRQQEPFLVPVDWIIRVPNNTAVYERVSSCHCSNVLHRPNPRWTWWRVRKRERGGERNGQREHEGQKEEMGWPEEEKKESVGKKRRLVQDVRSRSWNFRNKRGGGIGKGVGVKGRDRRGKKACRGVGREKIDCPASMLKSSFISGVYNLK